MTRNEVERFTVGLVVFAELCRGRFEPRRITDAGFRAMEPLFARLSDVVLDYQQATLPGRKDRDLRDENLLR